MYAAYFGLQREPFTIAPDPRFLFLSARHREALAHLLYGVDGGGGFVLLTGEIGAGKTTVCRAFLEQLPDKAVVAYVFNPRLSALELLQAICDEFRIERPAGADASLKPLVDALNAFLLDVHGQGRQALLVLDEAQQLSPEVLEQLRLLTNLETIERKLLQILLIGQPELRGIVAQPGLAQLAQRVIARYHLGALSRDETALYVRHRLAVAGLQGPPPFDDAALAELHRLTGGVPRRINLLADRALLGAYAAQRRGVDRALLRRAAREAFGEEPPRPAATGRWAGGAAAVLGGAALGAGALFGWQAWQAAQGVAGPLAAASASALAMPASAPASAASAPQPAASEPGAVPGVPGPPPRPVASDDPSLLLAEAHGQEATAWRELALRWNVAIGEGEPCAVAPRARLACQRIAGGGLPAVRQFDRPGIVALRDGRGSVRHALLVQLGADAATLQVGDQRFVLTLPALARVWGGDFATLWRVPPAWREGADFQADPAGRAWIAERLQAAGHGGPEPLRARVLAFQLAQGLAPDGLAGPLTLMRLARAGAEATDDEPRLQR